MEDAALDLFDRDGFDATTVDAIAAEAGISPRTFFHYFATKEDVVVADHGDRLARIIAVLGGQPPGLAPWSALEHSFVEVAADYESEKDQLLRRFRIMAGSPTVFARSLHLQAGWEVSLADALASRIGDPGHPDLTTRLMAGAALASMRASLQEWLASDGEPQLPGLVTACFERLGAGLR
nr:TetR family transcriptional regulator [Rhabdothermincola salaria]